MPQTAWQCYSQMNLDMRSDPRVVQRGREQKPGLRQRWAGAVPEDPAIVEARSLDAPQLVLPAPQRAELLAVEGRLLAQEIADDMRRGGNFNVAMDVHDHSVRLVSPAVNR